MLKPLSVPKRPLESEVSKARREADRAAAKAAEAQRKLDILLKAQSELIGALVEEHRNEVLHNPHSSSKIIDTMDAETSVRGARLGTKHPAALKIRKIDKSIARFADKHGLESTTVRSWYATGVAARKIPKKYVDILSKPPYSIPVTVWRNGVSE